MFKFLESEQNNIEHEIIKSNEVKSNTNLGSFQNHIINQSHYDLIGKVSTSSIKLANSEKGNIKFITISKLIEELGNFLKNEDHTLKILQSSTDLIPGIYEGGFKIWECSFDLISYLQMNLEKFPFGNCQVLDVGCGSGILGLFALRHGSTNVHFQDFNPEVINFLTIPNVLLNENDKEVSYCQFSSGSWKNFNKNYVNIQCKYDYILSSETVYSLTSFPDLIELVKTFLKPNGTMFLAAKSCYFGVGGGTKAFQSHMENYPELAIETCQVFRSGVQREILSVRWKIAS